MHGGLTAAGLPDPLQATVDAALDARLERGTARPVALGLSGGGDSLALLQLAADWCARAGRPLLALTVDHGLHPRSAAGTARAGRMAAQAGAGWRALAWTGPKPESGLPAAARAARHDLMATAAREAGACVLLLAHTAADVAEGEAMRAIDARTLGRLRAWAPSPAWPQGRGVFLLRPLLQTSRAELRDRMRAQGLAWLEDPANTDVRFARARARLSHPPAAPVAAESPPGFGEVTDDGRVRLPRALLATDPAARRSLRAALACAAGAEAGPRGAVIDGLLARLAVPGAFTATAGGARILADAAAVEIGRERGRTPPPPLPLTAGVWAVWDGRFEVRADAAGWSVCALSGHAGRLPRRDREAVRAIPAAFRGAQPALLREGGVVLGGEGLEIRSIVRARFDAAVGRIADEARLRRSTTR